MEKDSLISSAQESKSRVEEECATLQEKVQSLQKELSRVLLQKSQEESVAKEYQDYQHEQQMSVTQQVDLLMNQPQEMLSSWPGNQKQLQQTLLGIQDYLSTSISTLMNQVFIISGFGAKCRSLNSLPAFYCFMTKFSSKSG